MTNTSVDRDVSIGDLRITVRRGQTVNLLDRKHYHFTIEQLRKSAESGSLKAKSYFLKVREKAGAPRTVKMIQEIEPRRVLKSVPRNAVKIEEPKYKDLDFVEEADAEIARESAEAEAIDHRPLLAVDKKYFENGSDDGSEDKAK